MELICTLLFTKYCLSYITCFTLCCSYLKCEVCDLFSCAKIQFFIIKSKILSYSLAMKTYSRKRSVAGNLFAVG